MKRILCFGDSNTWGVDPVNSSKGINSSARFSMENRWPMLLEKELGKNYKVLAEGLGGRTTVFDDPMSSGRNGFQYLEVAFRTHDPIDYIIIMLGTNDTKDIYNASAEVISWGLERLVRELRNYMSDSLSQDAEILIVSPIYISKNRNGKYYCGFSKASEEKSKKLAGYYKNIAQTYGCNFLNAAEYASPSKEDGIHLGKGDHKALAKILTKKIIS
ncbi:MAG: SGNH/GDSL hydrolase family protein [Halanaerobiales bacterium]